MARKQIKLILITASLAVAALLLLSGCGEESPGSVVEKFINATADQDCEQMVDLMSEDSLMLFGESHDDAINGCKESLEQADVPKIEVTSFEVLEENIEGDTATVKFKATANVDGQDNEQEEEETYTLKKEDGEWKISIL